MTQIRFSTVQMQRSHDLRNSYFGSLKQFGCCSCKNGVFVSKISKIQGREKIGQAGLKEKTIN